MQLLSTLQRHRRFTLILVTHDPLVAAHAARFLFLHDGRLVGEHRPGDQDRHELLRYLHSQRWVNDDGGRAP